MEAPIDLPADAELVRRTVEFDERTVPAGLLAAHQLADGVWARLVVTGGSLEFTFEEHDVPPRTLFAGDRQVIPPRRLHRLAFDGPANFHLEFHRHRNGADGTVDGS